MAQTSAPKCASPSGYDFVAKCYNPKDSVAYHCEGDHMSTVILIRLVIILFSSNPIYFYINVYRKSYMTQR